MSSIKLGHFEVGGCVAARRLRRVGVDAEEGNFQV